MNILFISPTKYPELTGNAVSCERIAHGLRELGHEVTIKTPKEVEDIKEKPDVINAFHAYKSRVALDLSKKFDVPLVTTLTGSDFMLDIFNKEKRDELLHTLKESSAVTFYHEPSRKQLLKELPELEKKSFVIMKGLPLLPETEYNLRKELGKGTFNIISVGAIRKLKNSTCAIEPMEELHKKFPNLRLVYAGRILEEEYGKFFLSEIEKREWIVYLGEVSRDNIRGVFEGADLLMNCSSSEGTSNAILEAQLLGVPVIASNIVSNKVMISEESGLLYKHMNDDDLFEKTKMFFEDKDLQKKLKEGSSRWAKKLLNTKESEEYLVVYKKVIA